jgi:UDP-N-acetylglucosamine--N-acetylmuramyl-(pentapeptide) pyrophosphoryl-undecaprenol N-acetylglucosamine transferase
MPTILFVGGSSIGHIAPSVAVKESLEALKPTAQSHFVCLPSAMETEYLQENNCVFSTLNSPRLSLSFPWKFISAYKQAHVILNEVQPSVVFSKGGHISVPMCLAAKRKKIPIVLHESDSVSGRANRVVGAWAEKICTGFPLAKGSEKCVHTGNPIRNTVTHGTREEGLRITGLSGDRPVLLVVGGSQGAQAINTAIHLLAQELLELCDIVHITGKGKVGAGIQDSRYFQCEFAGKELSHFYCIADIALSRAGAGMLAELSANGIPTIVVPLRGVGHDHQQKNAEKAEEIGGCILLDQKNLDNKLVGAVNGCLADEKMRKTMSESIRMLSSSEASLHIAKILCDFLA